MQCTITNMLLLC